MAEQEKVPPFRSLGIRESVPYDTWMKSKGEFEQEGDMFGGVPGNMTNPFKAAWRGLTDTTRWDRLEQERERALQKADEDWKKRGGKQGKGPRDRYWEVYDKHMDWVKSPGWRPDAQAAMKGGASQMPPEQVQWTQEVTKNRERDKLRAQQFSPGGGASRMAPEQLAQIQMNMSPLVSQMRPEQLAQVQKRQEMMDHFKQMLEARQRAGMEPLPQGGY